MVMFPCDRSLSSSSVHSKFLIKSSSYRENAIIFYTDGSKMSDESSAYEIFFPELNLGVLHRLSIETSLYRGSGIIVCAIQIINDHDFAKAIIFTDSKRVLNVLTSPILNNKNYLIYSLKNKVLKSQRAGRKIILFWTPAHKDISGASRLPTLRLTTATHSSRYLDAFHCSSAVNGWWSIAT